MPARNVIHTLDAETGSGRVIAHDVTPEEARQIIDVLKRQNLRIGEGLSWEFNEGFLILCTPADRALDIRESIQWMFAGWQRDSVTTGGQHAA